MNVQRSYIPLPPYPPKTHKSTQNDEFHSERNADSVISSPEDGCKSEINKYIVCYLLSINL